MKTLCVVSEEESCYVYFFPYFMFLYQEFPTMCSWASQNNTHVKTSDMFLLSSLNIFQQIYNYLTTF